MLQRSSTTTHTAREVTRWSELTTRQRWGVALGGAVQLALAGAAWADLAMRPAAQVNGRKPLWAAVIAIN